MMAAHLQEVPKPPIVLRPGIPQTLNQIILMALAKDPGQRFQSADAFRGALKSVPPQGASASPAIDPRAFAPSSAANAGSATALFEETPASQSPTTVLDTPAYQRTQPVAPAAAAAPPPPVAPAVPPPAARTGGHRGLYIALGAFIVVAVLFAAGLYLPSRIKTLAGASKNPAATQQSQPAADSSATSSATPATPADSAATTPAVINPTDASSGAAQSAQSGQAGSETSNPSSAPAADAASPSNSSSANAGASPPQPAKKPASTKPKKDTQAADAEAQAKAEEAAQVQENEHRYDDIESRSAAVSQSLDTLQRQQAAAGYGLRGDIVSAQQRMKTDLAKAQGATQKQDTKGAKKYLDMAEAELQTIEKFLGR